MPPPKKKTTHWPVKKNTHYLSKSIGSPPPLLPGGGNYPTSLSLSLSIPRYWRCTLPEKGPLARSGFTLTLASERASAGGDLSLSLALSRARKPGHWATRRRSRTRAAHRERGRAREAVTTATTTSKARATLHSRVFLSLPLFFCVSIPICKTKVWVALRAFSVCMKRV